MDDLRKQVYSLFKKEFGDLGLDEYRMAFNEFVVSLPIEFSEDLLWRATILHKKDQKEMQDIVLEQRINIWKERNENNSRPKL
jgi:hypothetical protein